MREQFARELEQALAPRYQDWEGTWELKAANGGVSFSTLSSYSPFWEYWVLAVTALLCGFVSFVYFGAVWASGSGIGTDHAGWLLVITAVALVTVPWALYRVWPRPQGIQVIAEAGRLEAVRYYRGTLNTHLRETVPVRIVIRGAMKRMWKTVARRSDPGTTQQICDTRVTAILVETAVHELVEIAWANDHKLAVDTARRLAEVFQIAVDNETT